MQRVKIICDISPEQNLPLLSESLWAEDMGDDLYKLSNTPFFAEGLAYQDIIKTRHDSDGFLHFHTLHNDGGLYTSLVAVSEESEKAHEKLRAFLRADTDYSWEFGFKALYAICCPIKLLTPLHQFLEEGFEAGLWEWDATKLPTVDQWQAFNKTQQE